MLSMTIDAEAASRPASLCPALPADWAVPWATELDERETPPAAVSSESTIDTSAEDEVTTEARGPVTLRSAFESAEKTRLPPERDAPVTVTEALASVRPPPVLSLACSSMSPDPVSIDVPGVTVMLRARSSRSPSSLPVQRSWPVTVIDPPPASRMARRSGPPNARTARLSRPPTTRRPVWSSPVSTRCEPLPVTVMVRGVRSTNDSTSWALILVAPRARRRSPSSER